MNNSKIIMSDAYVGLSSLEDDSVDCAVTSPPYWGQRDYGFKGQIGNEERYSEYIEKLEAIYSELRNKLNLRGIFFLNIGDKYLSRYGNSKLGMIPYKLAEFMVENGWKLADTIIWHKTNHMPGSYTNRFTSTYEPVFVFAKSKNNYYSKFLEKNKSFSNVLPVNLQPTPYSHIAVYPEKLIEELLRLGLPKNSVVLDPFAGSGTTAKAVMNLNSKLDCGMSFILIEMNEKYVEIIKKRCNLSDVAVEEYEFMDYKTKRYRKNSAEKINLNSYQDHHEEKFDKIIKIFDSDDELKEFICKMKYGKIYDALRDDGVIYLGITNNSIENINLISTLNLHKWVIRNQLVIKNGNSWFPAYLIVKDVKKGKYSINIDAVRKEHKDKKKINWEKDSFIGYKVVNNFSKNRTEGHVVDVKEKYEDRFPKKVIIKWEDNRFSQERINYNGGLDANLLFHCPSCKNLLKKHYSTSEKINCNSCGNALWQSTDSIPIIRFKERHSTNVILNKDLKKKYFSIEKKIIKKENYNGKFKNEKTINFGASPGARSSTQETYFSTQRLYSFPQEMIADLLTIYLRESKLSKRELTEVFPAEYKHTVGHWFRKDLGGSLPSPEDMVKLRDVLKLPENYLTLNNSRAIKLQSVLNNYRGKNPGDLLSFESMDELKEFFLKTTEPVQLVH